MYGATRHTPPQSVELLWVTERGDQAVPGTYMQKSLWSCMNTPICFIKPTLNGDGLSSVLGGLGQPRVRGAGRSDMSASRARVPSVAQVFRTSPQECTMPLFGFHLGSSYANVVVPGDSCPGRVTRTGSSRGAGPLIRLYGSWRVWLLPDNASHEGPSPMPRPLRIEFPGACYHVMCRGNARLPIFHADADKELLLDRRAPNTGN